LNDVGGGQDQKLNPDCEGRKLLQDPLSHYATPKLDCKNLVRFPPGRSEGGVRNSIMDCGKNCFSAFLPSVTSFSSHAIEAREI